MGNFVGVCGENFGELCGGVCCGGLLWVGVECGGLWGGSGVVVGGLWRHFTGHSLLSRNFLQTHNSQNPTLNSLKEHVLLISKNYI